VGFGLLLTKSLDFLTKWVKAFEDAHRTPTDDGSDSDTTMGDTEDNPAILARIAALAKAHKDMPAWDNPFPKAWTD
jgi:hypothetical protein